MEFLGRISSFVSQGLRALEFRGKLTVCRRCMSEFGLHSRDVVA
jgi:hypothetical protein